MKIIGYDEKVKLNCTCRSCGAIIEYVAKEVQMKKVSCMGDVDVCYYITCPGCGEDVNNIKRCK